MSYFRKLLTIGVILVSTSVMSFALKAEYRFEKCDGSVTLENHAGSGLDGSLSGDAQIFMDGGKIENGLNFQGAGVMSVEQNANLDLDNHLTIAFWIKPSVLRKQALITKGLGTGSSRKYAGNAEYYIVMKEDGKIYYHHNSIVVAHTDTAITINEWTHIVLIRNNNSKKAKFYVNGVASSEYGYENSPETSNSEKLLLGKCVGCGDSVKDFKGKLDEVKFYNTVLSLATITTMYNSENGGRHDTGGCHPAPDAGDDALDLPYAGVVSVDILANDRGNDSEACSVDATTVQIVSHPSGTTLSDDNRTLTVPGEGVWSVLDSGFIRFTSEGSFRGNPAVISYMVLDSCGNSSNQATITLTRVAGGSNTGTPTGGEGGSGGGGYYTPQSTPTPAPTPSPTSSGCQTIGDRVWYDTNRNGIQDSGEAGVEGVTVVLFNSEDSVIDRNVTDSNGNYTFCVAEGRYTLGFSNLPSNYIFTSQNMGSSDVIDSDVDSSGRTATLVISGGESDLTYDVGIVTTNVDIRPSISDDNDEDVEIDCECEDYKTSIPAINRMGLLIILLLTGLLGVLFIKKEEEFNLNTK
jgi:hypothetical protein